MNPTSSTQSSIYSSFPKFFELTIHSPVSLDIAIAIAFGLFSALTSLAGVLLSYLTLRAMKKEYRKYLLTAFQLKSEANTIFGTEQARDMPFEQQPILRHEQTHIISPSHLLAEPETSRRRWRG
jgi:hypothetical protein